MSVKVAIIGAGSVGFTRKLFRDILSVPELRETEFAFTDISSQNLDLVSQLCWKDLKYNDISTKLVATQDRCEAVSDADYVINCSRIGGLEAFKHDIEIPLTYGVDQCVGDTICAGGIMYGQRNVPKILEFCSDIQNFSKPDALFLNYANPMAINTWAGLSQTNVRMVGLCHGVTNTWKQIAEVLGADTADQVQFLAAGINHQTWFIQIEYDGRAIPGPELLAAFESHPKYSTAEKVRIDVLKRFGYYSTESNGHLSEYLPWYRKRPDEILDWIDMTKWINGETGGYLRVSAERRNWFETDFPKWLAADDPPIDQQHRSTEHASYIIEAIETGRLYRGYFNVRNGGTISNLAADAIVEVPGYVDKLGIHIPRVGKLPLACAATCTASIDVQRMATRAAVDGDLKLLKLAMLHDPLVAAVCSPQEVWDMTDAMLVAQSEWLPQYAGKIEAAKRRLAAMPPSKSGETLGAARRVTRSIGELRASGEQLRGAR